MIAAILGVSLRTLDRRLPHLPIAPVPYLLPTIKWLRADVDRLASGTVRGVKASTRTQYAPIAAGASQLNAPRGATS